jgi:hypothetical protein
MLNLDELLFGGILSGALVKSRKIRNSKVLLQVHPKDRPIGLRILYVLLGVSFLYGMLNYLFGSQYLNPLLIVFGVLSCLLVSAYIVVSYLNIKTPLTFSELGITKPGTLAVFWHELSGYNILQDERRKGRKLLYVESNKPPFYHMRFSMLPRNLSWADVYFTDEEAMQVEKLFSSKGIPRMTRGGSGYP